MAHHHHHHHTNSGDLSPSSIKQKLTKTLSFLLPNQPSSPRSSELARSSSSSASASASNRKFNKTRSFFSRSLSTKQQVRRHSSSDFTYDANSHALNFDAAYDGVDDEENYHSFSSRLPRSPDRS